MKLRPGTAWLIPTAAICGILALVVAPITSHPFDMSAWISTQHRVFSGQFNPLSSWKFSLPLLALVLCMAGPALLVHAAAGVPLVLSQQFFIKLPFIAMYVLGGLLLFRLVQRVTHRERDAVLASALWLFSPAVFFFTAVHGQFDVLSSVLVIGALYCVAVERPAPALACLVGAAIAKLYAFFLFPLFWLALPIGARNARRRVVAMVLVSVAIAFGQLFFADTRDQLLSGVASSGLSESARSQWSLWGHPPFDQMAATPLWLLVAATVTGLVSLRLRYLARRGGGTVLDLTGCVFVVLVALVVLDPTANPQFVVWFIGPLIALTVGRRSPMRAALLVAAMLFGLASLLTSEPLHVWFVNAVPTVQRLDVWPDLLLPDRDLSRLFGRLYVVVLIAAAMWECASWTTPDLAATVRRGRVWHVAGALALSSATTLALATPVNRPVIWRSLAASPAAPPDLLRLNRFAATHVSGTGKSLRARFPRSASALLSHSVGRSYVVVAAGQALSVLRREAATGSAAITSRPLSTTLRFPTPQAHVQLEMLFFNDSYAKVGALPLPHIATRSGSNLPFIEAVTELYPTDGTRGFLVAVTPRLREFVTELELRVSGPAGHGWRWASAGTAPGGQVSAWAVVYGVTPDQMAEAAAVGAEARISQRALLLEYPLRLVGNAAEVALPVPAWAAAPTSVELVADVVTRPWWKRNVVAAVLLAGALCLGVVLFVVGLYRGAVWSFRRS